MKRIILSGFLIASICGLVAPLPSYSQTYSKTFLVKGKDGGVFRIRAYVQEAKGTKKNTVKMKSSGSAKADSGPKQAD